MTNTAEFFEAAKFANENLAMMACDQAVAHIDAIFSPVKIHGVWVVALEDYATGGSMGYLYVA